MLQYTINLHASATDIQQCSRITLTMTSQQVRMAASIGLSKELLMQLDMYPTLKAEQEAIIDFVSGRDVFISTYRIWKIIVFCAPAKDI